MRETLVEADTPAMGPDGRLREAIGVEALKGAFAPLVAVGTRVPCTVAQGFSTGEDNQGSLRLTLYRGKGKHVAEAHELGTFEVVGLPRVRRGVPQIQVTIIVTDGHIYLRAKEAKTGSPFEIRRIDS